jgi:hypothetical protein
MPAEVKRVTQPVLVQYQQTIPICSRAFAFPLRHRQIRRIDLRIAALIQKRGPSMFEMRPRVPVSTRREQRVTEVAMSYRIRRLNRQGTTELLDGRVELAKRS